MRLFDAEPELARALLTASLLRGQALLEMWDDMRRLTLPVRAAKFIHTLTPRGTSRLECTQTDLAFALGVSRVSIGKALKALERAGVIVLFYGGVETPDPDRLARWIFDHARIEPLKVASKSN